MFFAIRHTVQRVGPLKHIEKSPGLILTAVRTRDPGYSIL